MSEQQKLGKIEWLEKLNEYIVEHMALDVLSLPDVIDFDILYSDEPDPYHAAATYLKDLGAILHEEEKIFAPDDLKRK